MISYLVKFVEIRSQTKSKLIPGNHTPHPLHTLWESPPRPDQQAFQEVLCCGVQSPKQASRTTPDTPPEACERKIIQHYQTNYNINDKKDILYFYLNACSLHYMTTGGTVGAQNKYKTLWHFTSKTYQWNMYISQFKTGKSSALICKFLL